MLLAYELFMFLCWIALFLNHQCINIYEYLTYYENHNISNSL